jgi:hypothetical protein
MSEEYGIRLMLGVTPGQTHLWIDGHDLSPRLQSIAIKAQAADVTTIQIVLDALALDSPPIVIEGTLTVPAGALAGVLP